MTTRWVLLVGLLVGCTVDVEDDVSTAVSALCTRTPLGSGAGQSWNWGGGHGYPDIVDANGVGCDTQLFVSITPTTSLALFEALVEGTPPGTVVYLEGDVDFNMNGRVLEIPSDIWLVSDRGRIRSDGTSSPGALLRSTGDHGFIHVKGDRVRISGLRIWGDETAYCDPDVAACGDDDPSAILADGINFSANELEVDNCDIAGWGYAGVEVEGAEDADIHHNYIHHVHRVGLGYPVVVTGNENGVSVPANAEISYNRFQYYRHAIASSGGPGHEYHAHHNLAMDQAVGRVFDVHNDNNPPSSVAGGVTVVHDNIILPSYFYSFDVRGRPAVGAWFFSNCTTRHEASIWFGGEPVDCGGHGELPGDPNIGTVCQRNDSENLAIDVDDEGNPAPNAYSQTPSACATLRWCLSSAGRSPYRYLSSSQYGLTDGFAFGDFDGNGRTDVFRHTGSSWRVSFDGLTSWNTVSTNTTPLSSLRFGDFNGDGRTDVFRSLVLAPGEGTVWQYVAGEPASGGTWGSWVTLRTDYGAGYPISSLAVGYFDSTDTGVGAKADIFRASGTTWQYRKNGTGSTWYTLNASAPSSGLSGLAFHDFAGDARTDVFHATGTLWRLYTSGMSLAFSNANDLALNKLDFGDFDADGKTDVFYANGREWRYMSGGTGGWIQLAIAAEFYSEVHVANFDGDTSRADVFFPGCQ